MLRVAVLVACVMCLAGAAVADDDKTSGANPDLARAKLAIEKVNFDKALTALTLALERGANPRDQLAEIYRLLGEVYVTVGKPKQAKDYFGRLLMLKPFAKLSPGASPKLTQVLEGVRRSLQDSGALHVRAKLDRQKRTVTVVRDSDPLQLVRGAIIEYNRAGAASVERRSSKPGTYIVTLPAGSLRNLKLIAADKWGNHLHVFDLVLGLGERPSGTKPPMWKRWTSWAIAGGAFFVVGAVAGVSARGAQNDVDALRANSAAHFYSEFQSARSRGRRNALIANISFTLAVASAATSAYFFIKHRRRTGERRPRAGATNKRVVTLPFVGHGSAGIGVVGSFD